MYNFKNIWDWLKKMRTLVYDFVTAFKNMHEILLGGYMILNKGSEDMYEFVTALKYMHIMEFN